MEYYWQRRERLLRLLQEEGLNAGLISQPVNVSYLTGFSGDSSYLVVTPGQTILVSDGRFTEQIAEECPGLEAYIRPPSQALREAVTAVLGQLGLGALGFESGHLTVADFEALRESLPQLAWKGGVDRVERLRLVKDDQEVGQIRAAIAMAQKAFAMFRAMLRPEDCEKDLADAMEMYLRRAGGRCGSFPSIVAVGPRAALPHAPPSKVRVADSPLLLVDWGASGPFYKSDLTRVLLTRNNAAFRRLEPEADGKLQEIYAVVLGAQQQAIAAVRPGVQAQEVDAAARTVIADAGYGNCFLHSTGHGLGLQVHEAPLLKAGSLTVLQPGMVVTVEPGIYVAGWGGVRIEDDVLVTPDGCEVLTSLPRDLAANIIDW